jgi:hypothetical protein
MEEYVTYEEFNKLKSEIIDFETKVIKWKESLSGSGIDMTALDNLGASVENIKKQLVSKKK